MSGNPERVDDVASIVNLVLMLSGSAGRYLEAAADPEKGGEKKQNLELSRVSINLLGVLEVKTHGNLSSEEKQVLEAALTQLRLQYVRLTG